MTFPDHLPKLCPGCGSSHSEVVVGFYGWTCGSYNAAPDSDSLYFIQTIPCAVLHWKTRALKSEEALQGLLASFRNEEAKCREAELGRSVAGEHEFAMNWSARRAGVGWCICQLEAALREK